MRILLTNDDGVYAPGLRAMRTELAKLGEITKGNALDAFLVMSYNANRREERT